MPILTDCPSPYGLPIAKTISPISTLSESSISMEELAYWYWALEKENESNKSNLSKLEIRVKSLEKGCACFKQAQLAKR